MFGKIKVYHHFQLDTSSQEKKTKVNPTKSNMLERSLKKEKFEVFGFETGTNGARDGLLVGIKDTPRFEKTPDALKYIKRLLEELDLPYNYVGCYAKLEQAL